MRTASLFLTALMVFGATAAQAAPADAVLHELTVNEDADKQVVLVGGGEDIGFLEAYFPFTLDVQNPSVEDNLVGLWIGTLLPFGFLWSPFVFGDERPGDDFVLDAIIIELIHFAPTALLFIPIINIFLIFPVWIYLVTSWFYLVPVAIINAYDRSLSAGGGGRRAPSNKPKTRKRRRREAALELPSVATLDLNASPVAF